MFEDMPAEFRNYLKTFFFAVSLLVILSIIYVSNIFAFGKTILFIATPLILYQFQIFFDGKVSTAGYGLLAILLTLSTITTIFHGAAIFFLLAFNIELGVIVTILIIADLIYVRYRFREDPEVVELLYLPISVVWLIIFSILSIEFLGLRIMWT